MRHEMITPVNIQDLATMATKATGLNGWTLSREGRLSISKSYKDSSGAKTQGEHIGVCVTITETSESMTVSLHRKVGKTYTHSLSEDLRHYYRHGLINMLYERARKDLWEDWRSSR